MRGNYQPFNFESGLERIDAILDSSSLYEESDDIPKRNDLTFTNGKYVKCASIFIDLRSSSDLIKTQGRKSRTLARIYRAYISEMVAIVNSFKSCGEINIIGDCVSAVFAGKDGDEKPAVEALMAASMCNAVMGVLNVKFKKKWGSEFQEVKAGIGVALGRALVIKAGHSGSGINDLIYMGDVVNRASKMCGLAHKDIDEAICVTKGVYDDLDKYIANPSNGKTFQDFLEEKYHPTQGIVYAGEFVRSEIWDWVKENK